MPLLRVLRWGVHLPLRADEAPLYNVAVPPHGAVPAAGLRSAVRWERVLLRSLRRQLPCVLVLWMVRHAEQQQLGA